MRGYLLVDPTSLTDPQIMELVELIRIGNGWKHPDGVRWIVPVEAPNGVRDKCYREGWAKESIEVAH